MWFLTQEYDKKVFLKFMERNSLKKKISQRIYLIIGLFIVYSKS